jgi:hypothetical protein
MKSIAITMGLILFAIVYISETTIVANNHHEHNDFKYQEDIIGQDALLHL